MTTYRYRGQSLDGAKVTGVIRAYDEFEAVSQLRDRCAFITKIEPVKEKQGNPLTRPVNTRIREKELAMLCSQLSILLSSGLTALRCLQMVAAQTRNKQLRRALEKAAEEVGAGRSMADSLESNREVRFPATFVETVRAGEQSGSLEACLKRLALTGLYLGWMGNLLCLLLACVLGICAGLASGRRDAPIPWGPSIAAAAWVTLLTGDRVLQWYLSLFGM